MNEGIDDIIQHCTGTEVSLLDVDGTLLEDSNDRALYTRCGVDEAGRNRQWTDATRAVVSTMHRAEFSVGDLLERELGIIFNEFGSFTDFIAWMLPNLNILRGSAEMIHQLKRELRWTPIAATNGVDCIAAPILAASGMSMPMVCNRLIEDSFKPRIRFVHNRRVGLDKGELARALIRAGKRIKLCAGNSLTDAPMALETANHGGFVITRSNCSLEAWCRANLSAHSWMAFDNFADAIPYISTRV